MTSPNIPAKAVNAWIYLDEDDPKGTGYNSPNSSYQSLVNNNVYQSTDMLFVCFFSVIPDGKGFYTIDIGNATSVHPGGLTTAQYLQNVISNSRNQNPAIKILATLNYNDTTLSQIFAGSNNPTQWQVNCNAFAANLYAYLVANQMNGLDIDWELNLSRSITPQQFAILFNSIRTVFNSSQNTYFYLTLSPADIGGLDPATVNSCFDFVNLQLYGGADPDYYSTVGINADMMAYGAKFESEYQTADNAAQGYAQGFNYNGTQYIYQVATQWRLNSDNFAYEQGQQILLYQFIYGINNSSFDDTQIISNAGNPPITSLQINSGNVLDSIQATNTLSGTTVFELLQHGGNRGSCSTVTLQPGDVIVQVSGYTGVWFGWNCIVQITITTKNGNTYGPFGSMSGATSNSPFSYNAPQGQSIVAFKGTTVCVPESDGTLSYVIGSLGVLFG